MHPYHGSGYRFEIYGKEGTLAMIGGGEAGQEAQRKLFGGHKDDAKMQELPVPDRLKCVPEVVRQSGPGYDVGQMWVRFADAIRTNTPAEPDFDFAVRRHRMLDAIRRASDTGSVRKSSCDTPPLTLPWHDLHRRSGSGRGLSGGFFTGPFLRRRGWMPCSSLIIGSARASRAIR